MEEIARELAGRLDRARPGGGTTRDGIRSGFVNAAITTVRDGVGESVRRPDGVPEGQGRVRLLVGHVGRGHAVGRDAAHPASAGADPVDRRSAPALAVPGVHAVLTHEDVPGRKTYGLEHHDQPVLAFSEVRYQGEPVAIVAADHPETARRAADRDRGRVRGARAARRPRVRARARLAAAAPGGQPAAPRPHRARRRAGRGRRRGDRRVRGRDAGPGLPGPGVRARGAGRGRRRRPVDRDPVAARRPRPGRGLPRPAARRRCASRSPASAARSAGARTSRCRSTPACSRCTPGGR